MIRYEDEEFQNVKPKMKDNRKHYKHNFRNVDPKDILDDNWEGNDDEYYESFERFSK
jgi:hypothetical protein